MVCADPNSDWYGRLGTVTNFNKQNAGVRYDDDAAPPPTGRWHPKRHLVPVDQVDDSLAAEVAKHNEVRDLLQKAKESAQLAVHVYNSPTTSFRTGAYLVLMVIAWTAAMLSRFRRQGIDPYYTRKGDIEKVDGMPKVWSPEDCVRKTFPDQNNPIRKNLEFAIGVRNRVVHAHCPALDDTTFGECQALLNNFEPWVSETFHVDDVVGSRLTFALQTSLRRTPEQTQALKRFLGGSVTELLDFVDGFIDNLDDDVFADPRFRYRVMLVPMVASNDRHADAAVQFVPFDPDHPEAAAAVDQLRVLVKDRPVEVLGKGKLLPGDVARRVEDAIPWRFNASYHHAQAVKHFGVKPTDSNGGSAKTDSRYCVFSEPHGNYTYTTAWVEKLTGALADAAQFETIVGRPPTPKSARRK
ncbi:MAG: DUF3644 domain-containing protein [Myxococcota bacterium]